MTEPALARPRVLIIRNAERSGPGRLPAWLREEGLAIVETHGSAAPDTPDGYDAVVLLGGRFLPHDDTRHPWLRGERRRARRAVDSQVPLFGICLGAQLLAASRGGIVKGKHGTPERGSCPVAVLPGAADERLLHGPAASLPGSGSRLVTACHGAAPDVFPSLWL